MARLYSNENVLTIQDTGKADQSLPDPEVLKFATIENRALLTLNRLHFIRLHQKNAAMQESLFAPSIAISKPKQNAFTAQFLIMHRWLDNSCG